MSTHQAGRGKQSMGKTSTARKLTYGEAVAAELAHDRELMHAIDRSMADVAADRVLTLHEFVETMSKRAAKAEPAYQRSAD